jgi:hypothetical protein
MRARIVCMLRAPSSGHGAPRAGSRAWSRARLPVALAVAMLAIGAANASAVIVHLPSGKTISVQPRTGSTLAPTPFSGAAKKGKNLIYHGGPVMSSNTNYTLYWAPKGSPAYPAEYQSGVNKFFTDLAHDSGGNQNVDSVATQYNDGAGEFANYSSHFGGALIDEDPYPANGCVVSTICFTGTQLEEEIAKYVKAHGLPHDLAHEYFLLTPPGVEDCAEEATRECSAGTGEIFGAYCAYHGDIPVTGGAIIYSNDPFVTGVAGCDTGQHPNNKPSDGALQGGLSHEHNESLTDPEINAWYGPEGAENGDKCRTFEEASEYGTPLGTAPDGSPYNQLINGAEYWYQQEWSNIVTGCQQRLAVATPTLRKVSPRKGLSAGGTTVNITGTGLSPVSSVDFGGVPASSFTVNSPTSITAISPAHADGLVSVTVSGPNGTSPITKKAHFKFVK